MSSIKLGLIGDVHSYWTPEDVRFFNQSDYDALLFTGDLPRIVGGIRDARALSALEKPAVVIPGNHDGASVQQFLAELKNWSILCEHSLEGQKQRMQRYRLALGNVSLGGYSLHRLGHAGQSVDCIACRPHSMGGDRLYFAPYIREQFGIHSLEESADRLRQLVDQAGETLIFLAHNGPSGLGDHAEAPWGCDFRPEAGDFGDQDLRDAIDYARQQGKQVHAVVAGHMHHHLKRRRGQRQWLTTRDQVHYINAARVPRIFKQHDRIWHHHIRLTVSADSVSCTEVHVDPASGEAIDAT